MKSVIIRIALRYLAGILAAKGLLAPEIGDLLATDPEILAGLQVVSGMALAALAEGWYKLARQMGWET